MANKTVKAERPTTAQGETYHLKTPPNFFRNRPTAIAGAPGRARLLAGYLNNVDIKDNEKRGLVSVSGTYKDVPIAASTSGMGSASVFITLPEVIKSGGNIIVRLGSCGSTIRKSAVGDLIVVHRAYHWDGASAMAGNRNFRQKAFAALASEDWFSEALLTEADMNLSAILLCAGKAIDPEKAHIGEEYTTATFDIDQGRRGQNGYLPRFLARRHEAVLERNQGCYSMEAAAFFKYRKGSYVTAVNAVYAQRHTNEFEAGAGDEFAVQVVLNAFAGLANPA